MKKRNMIAALLCSACLVAGSVNPVFADASKVVTLGADLTDAQKQTMMKYFNVSSDQVQVMTITNEDEHKHLDNIAPQSQIGSRTLSCAYVKPTQSGGIKVRTANLNWVTGNMIATTLSTSGVKNCEVVAACPMEVSGTGALTGIQMAYEKASGEKLDETKTKLANQEIVTTGELADKVGKNEATTVVNQSKMDEIQNIVINVAEQNNISISQDDIDRIVSLLGQIAQQDYNYDDVKETLEQVDANTTGQASSSDDTLDGESSDATVDVDEDSSDDIVNNVNDSILGDDVIQSSTEDPGLEKETGADSQDTSNETGIPDATDDGTYGNEENSDESSTDESTSDESSTDDSASDESSTDESASDENSTDDSASDESSTDESASDEAASDETGIPEATEDTESSESTDGSDQADSAENDTSVLSEEAKNNYDKFVLFVKGEYEGDADSLLAATEDTETVATVTLDEQTAKNVAETVEKDYYDILKDGTESYEADGTEKYQSTELNMMDQKLKKLFGIDSSQEDTDATDVTAAILADVPQEDKQTLYKETMKYLAGLYGENTDASEESAAE